MTIEIVERFKLIHNELYDRCALGEHSLQAAPELYWNTALKLVEAEALTCVAEAIENSQENPFDIPI